VYLGPLILAQINLSIKVDSKHVSAAEAQITASESARPFRKVFASYSHKDKAIVEWVEEHLRQTHLGMEYLRDATHLRAGEVWSPKLMQMIEEANAFQLFWSTNSMYSSFVRQEYQYALSLRRQYFVLPVYWETPFPEKPEENLPPEELRRLHFESLAESTTAFHPSAQQMPAQPGAHKAASTEDTAELVSEETSASTGPTTPDLAPPTMIRSEGWPVESPRTRPSSQVIRLIPGLTILLVVASFGLFAAIALMYRSFSYSNMMPNTNEPMNANENSYKASRDSSPQIGTWKLNPAKAKFSPGSANNHTVVYEAMGDTVKVTVDEVDANGNPTHNEWTGKFDGKDYPVTGDPTSDTRSYKQINERTMELTGKKGGKVTLTARIVVSADGRSRTVTTTTTDANGKRFSTTAVYDKQ
ncbi:MAG: toll/interleukin-1 receptor domain-containing protein, partial [Pyrinomonadaceae bacterium]